MVGTISDQRTHSLGHSFHDQGLEPQTSNSNSAAWFNEMSDFCWNKRFDLESGYLDEYVLSHSRRCNVRTLNCTRYTLLWWVMVVS